jgi:hypothetical protein
METGMSTELSIEDFSEDDWDEVVNPVHHVYAELHDIVFHETADGTWSPTEMGIRTVPALIESSRSTLDRLEDVISRARTAITVVERDARLRALHRQRQS